LDARSGKKRWKRLIKNDFVNGKITIQKGLLTYYGRRLSAVDIHSGLERWSYYNAGYFGTFLFSSIVVHQHALSSDGYVIMGRAKELHHIDFKGRLLWKKRFLWKLLGLVVKEKIVLVVTTDEKMHALHPKTGRFLWHRPLSSGGALHDVRHSKSYSMSFRDIAPPAVSHGYIAYLGTDAYLSLYSAQKGTLLWKRKVGDHSFVSPVIDPSKGVVLIVGFEGTFASYDLKTGRLRWRYLLPSQKQKLSYRYYLTYSQTKPIFNKKNLWLGWFDEQQNFIIGQMERDPTRLLKQIKKLETLKTNIGEDFNKKEYIDLRFGDAVYYK